MKRFLFAVALAAAVPVSSPAAPEDLTADAAAISRQTRLLKEKSAPAAVDPAPVDALTERLAKDGSQHRMATGETANTISAQTRPDKRGHFIGREATLVEVPYTVGRTASAAYRDALYRREFVRLEAARDDWSVDPKTGAGQVEEWQYVLSLDGKLMSVERLIVPVVPIGPGESSLDMTKAQRARLSPSDTEVQEHWKEFSKELLTLHKVVVI